MRPIGSKGSGRGFTLVEMVVAMTLLAILAVTLVPLLRMPLLAYLDAAQHADADHELDVMSQKLRADLAQALPGSVRVVQTGARYRLEYLEVRAVARLRVGNQPGPQSCPVTCSAAGANDRLEPLCNDTCFTTLGPWVPASATPVAGSDYVVVDPLAGNPYQGGAATPAGSVKARLQALAATATGTRVSIVAHSYPSLPSPPQERQVYLVSGAVSYDCNPATQTLTRYWGYALTQAQPVAFAPNTASAVVARHVSACRFVAPALLSADRLGSVWVRLSRASVDAVGTQAQEFIHSFGVRGEP